MDNLIAATAWNQKKIPFSSIAYFLASICVMVLLLAFGGLESTLFIFFIMTVWAVLISDKKGLTDPRMLISGFFFMYHTWFHFRVLFEPFEYFSPIGFDVLYESALCSMFAYLVMINIFNFVLSARSETSSLFECQSKMRSSEKIIFYTLIIVCLISVVVFMRSGFSSKSDLSQSAGVLKTFSYFSVILLTVVSLLRAIRLDARMVWADRYVLAFLFVVVLYVGVTGERDVLFRALICLLVIYYDKKRTFNAIKLFGLLALAAFVVPVSQYFKAILLVGFSGVEMGDISVFSNEFISASRNLSYLINYGVEHNWAFLLNDLFRALVPTILFPSLDVGSTSQWYNSEYRVLHDFDGRAGWGFGLVAQGYLVGGYFGVTVVIGVCTAVIAYLYNRREKSVYLFVLYVLSLTVFIYILRADLANFVSQIFKVFGSSLVIIYLAHRALAVRKA